MNGNKPTVSVCVITYNQEKYIAQTIESILMQKTLFPIEIVIGNDASKDRTKAICLEYRKKYPELITFISHEVNIGMMPNFINTLNTCTGKYIAICEGDDYWSDPYKLQRQVDFLEKNDNYVGCFHNTEERYEEDDKSSFLYCKIPTSRNVTFKDLAASNLIPTCSVVFRNFDMQTLPEWYKNLQLGDWTLHLMNAVKNDFWYISKVMAVHRLHGESTWMLQDQKRNHQFVIDTYQTMIDSSTFNEWQLKVLKKMKNRFEQQSLLKSPTERFINKVGQKLYLRKPL